MVKNGEIRRQVGERIKPYRLRIFGYTWLYGFLASMILGVIGAIGGFLASFIGALISIPVCLFFKVSGEDVSLVTNIFSNPLSAIVGVATFIVTTILGIGYIRELILCAKEQASPVDFFSLGFKDAKKIAKVSLRLWLKYLPSLIILYIGEVILTIGMLYNGDQITSMIIGLSGFLLMAIGIVLFIIVVLLYQTISYDLIHDDKDLEPKALLAKSRETIRGHFWQWTRMNFFYSFLYALIIIAIVLLFSIGIGSGVYLAQSSGNGASVIGVLIIAVTFFIFVIGITASTFFFQYFSGKNVLNLEELYKAIMEEKGQTIKEVNKI